MRITADGVRLITLSEASRRRDQALATVEEHTSDQWRDAARDAFAQVARTHQRFRTDEVWDYLAEHYPDISPREPRAMGPVVRWAKSEGLIDPEPAGYAVGRGRERNSTPMPVYVSRVIRARLQRN